VAVKPSMLQDFWDVSLNGAEYVESRTKIRPEVFSVRDGTSSPTDAKIFMDFDSMAQYEDLFLHGLLYDAEYLTLAEQSLPMIVQEPSDEMFVLMDKDDFFMNLKDQSKRAPANLPRSALVPQRYRVCQHVDVTAGGLREVMKYSFDFMDKFEQEVGFRPQLFCTRFSRERIGCSKMYFDFDDCPMCDATIQRFNEQMMNDLPRVIDTIMPNEFYTQITRGS